jgi:hypothetical protein
MVKITMLFHLCMYVQVHSFRASVRGSACQVCGQIRACGCGAFQSGGRGAVGDISGFPADCQGKVYELVHVM